MTYSYIKQAFDAAKPAFVSSFTNIIPMLIRDPPTRVGQLDGETRATSVLKIVYEAMINVAGLPLYTIDSFFKTYISTGTAFIDEFKWASANTLLNQPFSNLYQVAEAPYIEPYVGSLMLENLRTQHVELGYNHTLIPSGNLHFTMDTLYKFEGPVASVMPIEPVSAYIEADQLGRINVPLVASHQTDLTFSIERLKTDKPLTSLRMIGVRYEDGRLLELDQDSVKADTMPTSSAPIASIGYNTDQGYSSTTRLLDQFLFNITITNTDDLSCMMITGLDTSTGVTTLLLSRFSNTRPFNIVSQTIRSNSADSIRFFTETNEDITDTVQATISTDSVHIADRFMTNPYGQSFTETYLNQAVVRSQYKPYNSNEGLSTGVRLLDSCGYSPYAFGHYHNEVQPIITDPVGTYLKQ